MNYFELIVAVVWMAIAVIIIIVGEDRDGDESEG